LRWKWWYRGGYERIKGSKGKEVNTWGAARECTETRITKRIYELPLKEHIKKKRVKCF
jgi:hypothetical protein